MIIIDLSEYPNIQITAASSYSDHPGISRPSPTAQSYCRNVSAPPRILQLKIKAISRPLWQLLLSAIESSQDIVLVFRILLL